MIDKFTYEVYNTLNKTDRRWFSITCLGKMKYDKIAVVLAKEVDGYFAF